MTKTPWGEPRSDFASDQPSPQLAELQTTADRNVFVMMRYREGRHFRVIESCIRSCLSEYGLIARFAKDRALVDGLWDNIVLYMRHCRFGLVVFEDIDEREFNPNISLELGYMYALGRRCLVLKEKRMPSLPTDICGKLYRDFDVLSLPESLNRQITQWCENDLALALAGSGRRDTVDAATKVVYDSGVDDPEFRAWGLFATDRRFDEHIHVAQADEREADLGLSWNLDLSTSGTESVDVNKAIAPLRGTVRIRYTAISSDATNLNLLFCVIPMRGKPNQLLEVGASGRAEPANAYSPYRARYFVPEQHIGDSRWHEANLAFDFSELSDATYSIFAPRINEGCPRPGVGRIRFTGFKLFVPLNDDVGGELRW